MAAKPIHRPAPGKTFGFAYHAGPYEIVFAGRAWKRGMVQPVNAEELKSMSRRAGWVIFEFRRVDPAND